MATIAVGCALGAALINKTITQKYWEPNLGDYSARLMGLSLHADQIDVAFVGSSHLLYSVDPLVFDEHRAASDSGQSYNMGEEAALMTIQLHTLRELREFQMSRLRYVFFEPMLLDVPFAGPSKYKNAFSPRNRFLYDLDNTRMTMTSRWSSYRPLSRRLGGVVAIGMAWLIHASNAGVIPDILFPLNPVSLGQSKWAWSQRGRNSRLEEKAIDRLDAPDLDSGYRHVSPAEIAVLERMLVEIESSGARPIIFLPPTRRRAGWRRAIREAVETNFPDILMLDYSFDTNPLDLYFDPDLWVDRDHLNDEGAKEFSILLARDWSIYISSPKTPH